VHPYENPFDDESGRFYVLVDDGGRHSLWPSFASIPSGWSAVHGPDDRGACLEYVEQRWTSLGSLA